MSVSKSRNCHRVLTLVQFLYIGCMSVCHQEQELSNSVDTSPVPSRNCHRVLTLVQFLYKGCMSVYKSRSCHRVLTLVQFLYIGCMSVTKSRNCHRVLTLVQFLYKGCMSVYKSRSCHRVLTLVQFLTRGEQELLGDRYRVSENNNTVHLSLHHVTREDGGVYTLVAKNAAGEARRAVKLLVAEAGRGGEEVPTFVRRLTDLAVKVGTRTRFLVEIRCTSDVKVSWHKNDHLVDEGERFHFLHEGTFFCVDVAPVMVEDGGRWTCMAEIPKAYKNPEFLEELRALLTEQGTVSLECKVVGVPTPVLKWYKDGKEIKAGDVFALTANPDDPTSLGTYTCEAVNCMGKTYSSSRVHVMGKGSREGSLRPADSLKPVGPPPIFAQELRNEKVKIGDTATLSCQGETDWGGGVPGGFGVGGTRKGTESAGGTQTEKGWEPLP
uniref:Ig-like domain-containing protein n=1 Tax=Timema bartmani TaxID=61472 RepID=A0A7R9I1C6_9NEOP|nr:unnamed protein product [Timema bartmani]